MLSGIAENSELTVLMVEAQPEHVQTLKEQLSAWTLYRAPTGWPAAKALDLDAKDVGLVIVYTRPREEAHALGVCQDVRQQTGLDQVPLLVAINRYQMMLGHDVRKLPWADFVFVPLERDSLVEKLEDMTAKTSQDSGD